jgi:hypothetical protein
VLNEVCDAGITTELREHGRDLTTMVCLVIEKVRDAPPKRMIVASI